MKLSDRNFRKHEGSLRNFLRRVDLLKKSAIFPTFVVGILLLGIFLSYFAIQEGPYHHNHFVNRQQMENMTVLINTWKREDMLKISVPHYAKCKSVEEIRIVWSESSAAPKTLQSSLEAKVSENSNKAIRLVFDVHQEKDLNVRLKPLRDSATDGIFSVDDDILVPCKTLELAFAVWQSAKDSMVGFVPRIHLKKSSSSQHLEYGGWWSVWWTGSYSMILTKAAILHQKYFSLYTSEMPATIRDYVTKHRNCEDIAMSFLVANATHAPPIWVKSKLQDKGGKGISSGSGHWDKRTQCLNDFIHLFGGMPLVTAHSKVVDSRKDFFW